MNRRTMLTVSTAGSLYGAYTLYSLFVSPLFTPPPLEARKEHTFVASAPRRNVEQATRYLSHADWAASAKYQVHRGPLYIFTENWDRVEPSGEVRFSPFAMVWHPHETEGEGEPVVITSDAALVRFEKPFDIADPNPGRIIGGALEGAVSIRGDKGLRLDGRQFLFSENALRVWSNQPLTFAYDQNNGSATGVELDLIAGPPEGDGPAVSGVKTVRLRRDVVMNLTRVDPDSPRVEKAHVTSVGAFEFLIDQSIATFRDRVVVRRPQPGNHVDSLTCDALTLHFVNRPATATAPPAEAPPGGVAPEVPAKKTPDFEDLEFQKMFAVGKPCRITSSKSEFEAKTARLDYDAQSHTIELVDPEGVVVTQKNNVMRSTNIQVLQDDHGEVVSARCEGQGQLWSHDTDVTPLAENPPVAFSASWSEYLRKEFDEEAQLDRIELKGNVALSDPSRLTVHSDVTRIWLVKTDPTAGDKGIDEPARKDDLAGFGGKLKPKKLLSVGNVRFSGTELTGRTGRLEINFEEGMLPLLRPQKKSAARRQLRDSQQPLAWPEIQPLNWARASFAAVESTPPVGGASAGANAARVPVRAAARGQPDNAGPLLNPKTSKARVPIDLTADSVRLRTIMDGRQTHVAEIWTEGHVDVRQARDAGEDPFRLQGNWLHIINYSENDQIVQIRGEPATVRDRGLELDGPEIVLDRGENDVQIDGAGRLRLPVRNGPDGKPLAVPQSLDVFWQEQMIFDGATASFYSQVRAQMADSSMRCAEMHVSLTERLNFSRSIGEGRQPGVKLVHCRDGVEFDTREMQDGKLAAVRRVKTSDVWLDQATGDTVAQGPPGEVLMWLRGGGTRAGLGVPANANANRAQNPKKTAGWEYIRVEFSGSMRGNIQKKTSTFYDRVLVVYGPVRNESATIDPDSLPEDGGWMQCEQLRLVQREPDGGGEAYTEMLASGNAQVEGRSFHGLADNISFDQSKDQYVIRSLGTRLASVWRQVKPGTPRSRVNAQSMLFIPSRNILKLSGTSAIDGRE